MREFFVINSSKNRIIFERYSLIKNRCMFVDNIYLKNIEKVEDIVNKFIFIDKYNKYVLIIVKKLRKSDMHSTESYLYIIDINAMSIVFQTKIKDFNWINGWVNTNLHGGFDVFEDMSEKNIFVKRNSTNLVLTRRWSFIPPIWNPQDRGICEIRLWENDRVFLRTVVDILNKNKIVTAHHGIQPFFDDKLLRFASNYYLIDEKSKLFIVYGINGSILDNNPEIMIFRSINKYAIERFKIHNNNCRYIKKWGSYIVVGTNSIYNDINLNINKKYIEIFNSSLDLVACIPGDECVSNGELQRNLAC